MVLNFQQIRKGDVIKIGEGLKARILLITSGTKTHPPLSSSILYKEAIGISIDNKPYKDYIYKSDQLLRNAKKYLNKEHRERLEKAHFLIKL